MKDFRIILNIMLPTLIIVTQHISIGRIKLSWVLALLIFGCILYSINIVSSKQTLLTISFIVIFYPLISFFWGDADTFNSSLYFSLLSGLNFAIYISIQRNEGFKQIAYGILLSCIVFTMWGLYEMYTGRYITALNTESELVFRNNFRGLSYPFAAFSNANDLGQYLSMLYPPVSVYCYTHAAKTRHKNIIIALSLLIFYIILNTESNLSMMGYVFSFLIFFTTYLFKSKFAILSWLTVIFILIVITEEYILEMHFFDEMYQNVLFVNRDDAHYTSREYIYTNLLNNFLDNPLGGFGNAYSFIDDPHNLFLYILCDFGIIGIILFSVFCLYLGREIYSSSKIDYMKEYYTMLLICLLLFPLSSSISSGNEQRKAIWLFLGLCMSALFACNSSSESPTAKEESDLTLPNPQDN